MFNVQCSTCSTFWVRWSVGLFEAEEDRGTFPVS